MKEPLIHLWPGASFHEDVYIVGNRRGLEKIKARIDSVLNSGGPEKTEVMTADGEGYSIHIILAEDDTKLALPYTEDYAKENRENVIYPWDQSW
jgi:hypothetical protein